MKKLESFYTDSAVLLDEMMGSKEFSVTKEEEKLLQDIKNSERTVTPVMRKVISLKVYDY